MQLISKNDSEFTRYLNTATKKELSEITRHFCMEASPEELSALAYCANRLREIHYGRRVYFRGLIEFSNHCRKDCYYCGIRKSNLNARRYRLSAEEILNCCQNGYNLGFRTFVLQSGEDSYFTDERLCAIVTAIKQRFPDCALTLSIGERSRDSYQRLYDAGTDRYLLRHETADEAHYGNLHPPVMSLRNRKQCLSSLKEIGYQVGAGLMVESPYQTFDTLAEDLILLRELKPHMIGVGPFIPHRDTRFAGLDTPSSERTLVLLSLVRIMLPKALLPSTTALGTIDALGREKGLKAGANIVMPNLSPVENRSDYSLYDNKICTGEEAAECLHCLTNRIVSAGYEPDFSRGDHVDLLKREG
ncbi:MAG: [FeFe] hydrogenase H-cluster radical SAM maturase HydE [Gracilibacter sp. BRH_c7a]|nr:MAG: [FeFe] hydrogenase H-cluster radical SAM maturase HydE [Gracilibacter sp. BRH_c7a]